MTKQHLSQIPKYFLNVIACLSLILLFSSCTKYKEEAPFFDGLVLEYNLMQKTLTYKIKSLDNNQFKINMIIKFDILSDETEEFLVDAHGKVRESSTEDYQGNFSDIWIPAHKMEFGDTFDDGYTVLRREQWKKWQVLVVKNPLIDEERYYEISTGFWVGSNTKTRIGTGTIVLSNTNADIPTIE